MILPIFRVVGWVFDEESLFVLFGYRVSFGVYYTVDDLKSDVLNYSRK